MLRGHPAKSNVSRTLRTQEPTLTVLLSGRNCLQILADPIRLDEEADAVILQHGDAVHAVAKDTSILVEELTEGLVLSCASRDFAVTSARK